MQIGVYSLGDRTPDPVTGRTPTDHERLLNTARVAEHAEAAGFDVFAVGEHHTTTYAVSAPAVLLGYLAARTNRIRLSTATTLITTNDPVRLAEDYATVQHLCGGRLDLMLGRRIYGPVYSWFVPRGVHESSLRTTPRSGGDETRKERARRSSLSAVATPSR